MTVGVTELIEGFVQVGSNFVPELGAFGWFHSGGVLFARATSGFGAPDINRDMNGGAMEPRDKFGIAFRFRNRLGKACEDRLRHLLG